MNWDSSGIENIRIIKGEDGAKLRPEMYLDSDNPVWRKIAEDEMARRNKDELRPHYDLSKLKRVPKDKLKRKKHGKA